MSQRSFVEILLDDSYLWATSGDICNGVIIVLLVTVGITNIG